MKFTLKVAKPHSLDVDSLNLFAFENEENEAIKNLPSDIITDLERAFKKENFKGSSSDQLVVSGSLGQASFYKLSVTGLGTKDELDLNSLSEGVARSIRAAKQQKGVKVALEIPDFWFKNIAAESVVEAVVAACLLASYKFSKYKSAEEKSKDRAIEEVILIVPPGKLSPASAGLKSGQITAKAALYTRDLVNEPAQVTTPSFLAEEAVRIAKNSGGSVQATVLDEEDIKKLKMEAFLGVARGSHQPPKFIILRYKKNRPRKKIAILGKGITFDTGGLSLKGAEHMETMKLDMAGAAAVLGIFSVIGELNPSVEAVGIIAACENMPGGRALKPGDILRAFNGKTIEVLNTDAEGRLTLADAISYAVKKEKPDAIIDLATLTGACAVALGENIAGIFSDSEKMSTELIKASKESGDKIWRLPLEKSYRKLIKSPIADIKNIQTGKYGGAITAALFLKEFSDKVPFVHLDIAGPAFAEKDSPLTPVGGTGFGVRLLLQYLRAV